MQKRTIVLYFRRLLIKYKVSNVTYYDYMRYLNLNIFKQRRLQYIVNCTLYFCVLIQ